MTDGVPDGRSEGVSYREADQEKAVLQLMLEFTTIDQLK